MVGRAVLGEPQPGRGTRPACPRRIVAYADDLAGPVLHLAPCGQLLEIIRRQIHRRPRDEPSVLFLAERLGTRNRRPPLARLRPRAAVLRPLDPIQNQDRIWSGAGEGVVGHAPICSIPLICSAIVLLKSATNLQRVSHSSSSKGISCSTKHESLS